MIVELDQLHLAEDLGQPARCGICGAGFEQGVVFASAKTDSRDEIGEVCLSCIEMLGSHYPERFPTLEEYKARQAEWKTPTYSSMEEADRALGYCD